MKPKLLSEAEFKRTFAELLVMSQTKNVYLVIIVDVATASVRGHHVLDLNREFGIE